MKMTNDILNNELNQLITMLKVKGETELRAVAFVAGLAYSVLDDTQKDELFQIVSRA